ncbi:unnamed protein product, partial [Rotaria sordida]
MPETGVPTYRVYGIRWIQLIVYVLATFANAMCSMTFSPIESEASKFYSISTAEVNTLTIIFLFLYVNWYNIIHMVITNIFNAYNNDYWIYIKFRSIGAPFFLNSTALFAARWFPPSQRDIATAICSMAYPLGLAIGSLVPSFI